jgi:L,D-peptidoglycan transpeptidase YkuD (ErfK/YbiS/YcfS/YnhG family)
MLNSLSGAAAYGRAQRAATAPCAAKDAPLDPLYPCGVILRRTILAAVSAVPLSRAAAAMSYANLIYRDAMLTWPGGSARAAAGKAGVKPDKREGDHASPAGTFPLLYGFFRADRVPWPRTDLPLTPLQANFGWCDDPVDPHYNQLVSLPYTASHEELWRADALYDLIAVIGYNTDPVVRGAGSAIFLHVAAPDFAPTEGCIAIARDALVALLGLLGPGSTITIEM